MNRQRRWYAKNRALQAQRYIEDRPRILAQVRKYRQENAGKIAVARHEKYLENKESVLKKTREWHRNNPEKRKVIADRYRVKVEPHLRGILRARLREAIKRGSPVRDLGCSIPVLKKYLESKFKEGMSWENWGTKGWHIDHIKPLAKFNLSDRKQFLQACHYTNLQPLWWYENLAKGSRV